MAGPSFKVARVKTKPQKLPDFEQSLSELEALVAKLEYNRTREDHTDEARRGVHGKKI
jgi:exonuclease VII small subunit